MELKINPDIFDEENSLFFNEYVELLINRLTHSTMLLEKDLGDPDTPENAIKFKDNMDAFKILLNKLNNKEKLNEELINIVANTINRSSKFIKEGYRNSGRTISDTNIPISKPENIKSDLNRLINNYNENWNILDFYLKEAEFHIKFIRIHPFEDGNGRTARLLLNYNLISNGLSPVILTKDLTEYYQSLIRNYDTENLAKLFRIQAFKEQNVINELFEEYKKENKKLHQ